MTKGFRNDFGKWFPTATEALDWLRTEIYVSPGERDRALAELEAGEPVTMAYGFKDLSIYPNA